MTNGRPRGGHMAESFMTNGRPRGDTWQGLMRTHEVG